MADNALLFGGVNSSYVLVKNGRILQSLTNWSISLWFKTRTTGTPAASGWAIYSERAAAGNDIVKVDMFGSASAGKVGLTYRDDAGTLDQPQSVATYNDALPHHILITKAGTALKIYMDGTLVTSTTLTAGNTMTNASTSSRIGGDIADTNANFDGTIDDVQLYANTVLVLQDAVDLAAKKSITTASTDRWRFDEGTGTSAADSTGSNTGTLSGTTLPTWTTGLSGTTPLVSTDSVSSIGIRQATANASITSDGNQTITGRGVQYNTVQYPDKSVDETGTFSVASYTELIEHLTPGQTYYVRAYATNSFGTSYGSWVSFTTTTSQYEINIDGVDRTADVVSQTLVISDELNDKQNTCTFRLMNLSGTGIPSTDDEIIITMPDGTIAFGGYIVNISLTPTTNSGEVGAIVNCVDYVRLLDRNLVNRGYTDMTDAEIIEDIVTTYCPGFGITTTNVVEGVTIDQINFNYIQPSQALRRICDLTGRNWFIDYNKDVHYFPMLTDVAPFNITDAQDISDDYSNLVISKDATQIKNRVYVRGGTRLSDATFYETKGDGAARKFVLPDKPHDVVVKVNGVTKTLGIKNIDTSGFDYYLNFQEKYVEQDSGATLLATTDTLRVEYTYDIPILVAVENTASIAANGQKEFAIFDKTITTQQAARDRASAELTDYANNIIEGSFRTFVDGFRSGQYMTINVADYGINAQYIIQKVVAHSLGAGLYYYDVSIASAKTMGIIRFLIELLEANNKLIELNDDEVVDNLLSVTDSLLSDSLTDALTIDSAGPYATWCTDSLTATATRARWDLFEWF